MEKRFTSLDNVEADYYRLLVEQVKEYAILLLTPDGFVASWNTGAERITGWTCDEILGKHFSIFNEAGATLPDKARNELETAYTRGRYEDYGWRLRKDGSRFWGNEILTPIYDKNKKFIGYSKVIRDLTERKRAEESLLRSREEFRTLANSLPHVVWTADSNGFITYWNQSFYQYTGLTEKDIHNVKVPDTVHPDDVENLRGLWREAVSTGTGFEAEFRLKSRTGEYRWHAGRAKPLKDPQGNVLKWIGSSLDIHERKLSAEKKDEFIGIAGHELRTPLTSIKAYAQLIERSIDSGDTETAKKYVNKAYTFIDKLNELIAELLDISKIQRGKMPFDLRTLNIDDLLKECVESYQLTITSHRIIVEGSTGAMIRADKPRLEQVISNYLSNAVKYSPGEDTVHVMLTRENDHVQISVKDHGIGIPEDQLNNVFNKFYRAENMSSSIQGLGLGLYISAEIVKLHGGKVGVTSEEGKGSDFWFRLPVYSAGADSAGGQNPSSFQA
jgi:PAS domain S-box-containing protein